MQFPTSCPQHLHQHLDHVMDIGARLFVDVVPKVLLRPLARKMWANVFGPPWQDGVQCGRALLYGRLDQSPLLDDKLEFKEGKPKVTILGWECVSSYATTRPTLHRVHKNVTQDRASPSASR